MKIQLISLTLMVLVAMAAGRPALAQNPAESAMLENRTRDFCMDWRFAKGEQAGAQASDYDDSGWQPVDLPHDWGIEGPKLKDAPGGNRIGYFPTGVGWYRRHFQLTPGLEGRKIFLQFDGILENSEVWINGQSLGSRPYGYSSFQVDLTPHVKFGGDNVVAVRVDTSKQPNSRWYTGSGIYRQVHLTVTDKLHVAHWGTYVTASEISEAQARVRIATDVRNAYGEPRDCKLISRIFDPAGKMIREQSTGHEIPAGSTQSFVHEFIQPNPDLWSIETPRLYRIVTVVQTGGQTCDAYETPFGIRDVQFDRDQGFFLNGQPVELKGVNLHHDGGSLGAAVPVRAWERRLEILKSIGCNAIRTSHNPPAPELLDLCDRMGFVVIDEAFDKWDPPYGRWFADWGQEDLLTMIRRDRNHPSVVLWSVGNEISNQGSPEFLAQLEQLVAWTREADPSRPVTLALRPFTSESGESNIRKGVEAARLVDVIGLNYQEQWFEGYREAYPEIKIIGTEIFPWFRGKGDKVKAFHQVNPWLDAEKHGYVAGSFYWTGIDYLGEAVAGWPFHGWNGSLIDTCGFIRPNAQLVKSFWTQEPMVHIAVIDDALDVPEPTKDHWGWPDMVSHWNMPEQLQGKTVKIATFTNCIAVELLLNGRSLGTKQLADFPEDRMIAFDVPVEPGTLEARGIVDGEVKATHQLKTAGQPAKIRLTADRGVIRADGKDLAYIEVQVTDSEGVLVPSAHPELRFSVEGAGRIVGVDNGDLTSMESYKGETRSAYYGLAQVIVQADREPGVIRVSVQSEGLPDAELTIESE